MSVMKQVVSCLLVTQKAATALKEALKISCDQYLANNIQYAHFLFLAAFVDDHYER
jgi:hypothetical protein